MRLCGDIRTEILWHLPAWTHHQLQCRSAIQIRYITSVPWVQSRVDSHSWWWWVMSIATICNLHYMYHFCYRQGSSRVPVFRWKYNRVPVWHRVSPLDTWWRLLVLPLQPSPDRRGSMWLWPDERPLSGGPQLYWWPVSRYIIFRVAFLMLKQYCRDPLRQWVLDPGQWRWHTEVQLWHWVSALDTWGRLLGWDQPPLLPLHPASGTPGVLQLYWEEAAVWHRPHVWTGGLC